MLSFFEFLFSLRLRHTRNDRTGTRQPIRESKEGFGLLLINSSFAIMILRCAPGPTYTEARTAKKIIRKMNMAGEEKKNDEI